MFDGEDAEAIAIAVVALHLANPCPGRAVGIRAMVVVAVQGARV